MQQYSYHIAPPRCEVMRWSESKEVGAGKPCPELKTKEWHHV
jgi:hypothetical protein